MRPDGSGLTQVAVCGPGVPTPGNLGSITKWSPDLDGAEGYQGLLLFGYYLADNGRWQVRGLWTEIVEGALTFPNGAEVADSVLVLDGTSLCHWSPDGARIAWPAAGIVYVLDVAFDGLGMPVLPVDPATAWTGYPAGHSVSAWSWDSSHLAGQGVDGLGNSLGLYKYPVPEVLSGSVAPVSLSTDLGRIWSWSPPVFPVP